MFYMLCFVCKFAHNQPLWYVSGDATRRNQCLWSWIIQMMINVKLHIKGQKLDIAKFQRYKLSKFVSRGWSYYTIIIFEQFVLDISLSFLSYQICYGSINTF